jgi:hypothetical protein
VLAVELEVGAPDVMAASPFADEHLLRSWAAWEWK